MGPACRVFIVGFLVICGTALPAQERHLGNGSASSLYARSAFAHGYIHGYEEGFHHGDLDLQLGRSPRDPTSFHAYKHPYAVFHSSFGSKHSFKAGFEDGFSAGYSDVTHQLAFRAVTELQTASNGLVRSGSNQHAFFDGGFKEGYREGRRHGTNDGREDATPNPIQPPCLGRAEDYCDAFGRAFQFGYDDGYANQAVSREKPQPLEARVQK